MIVCGVIKVRGMSSSSFINKIRRVITPADIFWGYLGCKADKGYWIDKYNIRHKIIEMEFEHIFFCICLIKRFKRPLEDFEKIKLEELENELKRRENYTS